MESKTVYNSTKDEDLLKLSEILQMKSEDIIKTIDHANIAKSNAYCPYSKFRVGSCLFTTKGDFIQGCNVENISYGVTICAERSAICSAISQGIDKNTFHLITVTFDRNEFLTPCGACRQFIAEFSSIKHVAFISNDGRIKLSTPGELLPLQFECEF